MELIRNGGFEDSISAPRCWMLGSSSDAEIISDPAQAQEGRNCLLTRKPLSLLQDLGRRGGNVYSSNGFVTLHVRNADDSQGARVSVETVATVRSLPPSVQDVPPQSGWVRIEAAVPLSVPLRGIRIRISAAEGAPVYLDNVSLEGWEVKAVPSFLAKILRRFCFLADGEIRRAISLVPNACS